ncbi:hypothetical protein [Pseudomonas hormoni]
MNRSALNTRREERYAQGVIQHYLQSPQRDLPALAYEICIYLAECYACGNVRHLASKVLAIGRWHTENGFPDPTECSSVIELTRLIRAKTAPKASLVIQPPPTISDVKYITDALQHYFNPTGSVPNALTPSRKAACRNRVIWLIGFWFGLSTSEVCRLRTQDVRLNQNALTITTKGISDDQSQTKFSFRLTRLPILCPVSALEDWLNISDNSVDYLFPRTTKKSLSGPIGSRSVHAYVRGLMTTTPDVSVNTGSQRYSLYFFLIANGWSRNKILETLPIYQKDPSKTRTTKTKNHLNPENLPPWLSDADIHAINHALTAHQPHMLPNISLK